ncbi:hypothetical protein EV641_114135 [Rhodococcus sp. SMB37]|uniref:PASTA domain-containing protein n=1 Tax=Rhodococcus sp. SMB37 TaxID=2512213 RepID=UPI00104A57C2|nr:PASTA domain-containing protein [Rhodococcus sp. SMB37]TCN49852.1 hypothetical protein EV641_114135 [Rhodococcus sp. SMB37]
MRFVVPYLRVLAGMFAGVTMWLAIVEIVNGNVPEALIQLLFTVGLGYLAVGKPLRDRRARIKAEEDALAARAEAGHRAFLAGDPSAAFAPPPEPPKPQKIRRGVVIAAMIAAAFVLIGIIGDLSDGLDAPSDDNATTTPQTSTQATATPTVPVATSAATTAAAVTPAAVAVPTPSSKAASAQSAAIMPNVVCMDLQAAQDTIQAAGVFYSRSVDATGEGRAQVWDRNWVVVEQSPSAGAVIGEGDAVLSVVKEDEPSGCY